MSIVSLTNNFFLILFIYPILPIIYIICNLLENDLILNYVICKSNTINLNNIF